MNTFHLRVLSPDHPYYEGECESLVITTSEGEYGVLANHSNTIIALAPGTLKLQVPSAAGSSTSASGSASSDATATASATGGSRSMLAATSYGMMKIENNQVLILVNTIENPDEIDEARARRAAEEAQEALLHQQSKVDYIQAQAKMARAMNRLKVKNKAK